MADKYLMLEDHYVNGNYIQAGTTTDTASLLPSGWVPTPNVDPLNTSAVLAFYNAGPMLAGLIRVQWVGIIGPTPPVTYWTPVGKQWGLTGLGKNRATYPLVEAN